MDHWRPSLACLLLVAVLMGCATDTTRRDSLSMIRNGQYEEGLARLEQQAQSDPKNVESQTDYTHQREQAVNRLLNSARSEQTQERFDAADALYLSLIHI